MACLLMLATLRNSLGIKNRPLASYINNFSAALHDAQNLASSGPDLQRLGICRLGILDFQIDQVLHNNFPVLERM